MRLLANHFPWLLNRLVLKLCYKLGETPPEKPDLIISAGGNTLFANVAMARIYNSPNIFSGTTKGYDHTLLRLIFTVRPLADSRNNVVLELPPANVELLPADAHVQEGRFYALLVGGEGAGYQYTESDWLNLAGALGEIAKEERIRWLLTTSRRTGEKAEKSLRTALPTDCCEQAVWYATNPEKVVKKFLSRCEAVFCTEDSLTMIAEAIYAHKPVITLQPDTMVPERNDAEALQNYVTSGFIQRVKINNLANFRVANHPFCESYPDMEQQISQAVREYCV